MVKAEFVQLLNDNKTKIDEVTNTTVITNMTNFTTITVDESACATNIPKSTPKFKRIGDMISVDGQKPVPIRKLTKEMRKLVGIK